MIKYYFIIIIGVKNFNIHELQIKKIKKLNNFYSNISPTHKN